MTDTFRITVIDPRGADRDVAVTVEDDSTMADLVRELNAMGFQGDTLWRGPLALPGTATLPAAGITHGVRLSFVSDEEASNPGVGRYVVGVSGPAAGALAELKTGLPLVVGRMGEDIAVDDPTMSRVHCSFHLSASGAASIQDMASSSGTFVEGRAAMSGEVLNDGDHVRAGHSVFTLTTIAADDRAAFGALDGPAYDFPRAFRQARPDLPTAVEAPKAPGKETQSGSTWIRALVPVISGVGFAVISGRYIFLLVALLGPLVYLFDGQRQKKRRKREHAEAVAEYEAGRAQATADAIRIGQEHRARNRVDRPFGGTASLFGLARHRRLWERRPVDPDFLSVTVGLASQPVPVQITGGALAEPLPDLWGVPLSVPLIETGSLAVLGAVERGRAAARGLAIGLAATHSPTELQIWVFAGHDSTDDWEFARWLPHNMIGSASNRLTVDRESRSSQLADLLQVIELRTEGQRNDKAVALPVIVAFVDGSSSVPAADLARVVREGPAAGVIAIVIDQRYAPDGTSGEITLLADGGARFESRLQPLVPDLIPPEMSRVAAEPVARRLASIRPLDAQGVNNKMTSALVDLVGFDQTSTPQHTAQRWAQHSGSTDVIVGRASDSTVRMDIVRGGPHGLVGGATRSGKTEFLKTLIVSLCYANHPDDLNFVIVDFKGGIDYEMAHDLPHVLEVSSNQDLDRFERTVRMLNAEQERRQRLFKQANVANLDSYRAARRSDPELPAVPRLIVLVDEFGELNSTEVGKGHLRQLESITRIGAALGVNLMLITQNFSGQLPDQIAANTGLRISFRVEDPSHSKILLSSGIASTVSGDAKGRGYFKTLGSDPLEFQSSRIAGRRRDIASTERSVSVSLRPVEMLWREDGADTGGDVPGPEQDMYAVIQHLVAASDLDRVEGYESPIPWPEATPDDIGLDEVWTASPHGAPVGLLDVPNQQCQVPFHLSVDDDHVLLLGGPSADLSHGLTMIAAANVLRSSPDDLHIYGIDLAGRALARLGTLPHCGAVASRNETLTVRLIRLLLSDSAMRRSALTQAGVTNLRELRDRTGIEFPHVVVLIAGGERLLPSNRDDNSMVAPLIGQLILETAGLGIQVVLSGTPQCGSYRPGNSIERRIAMSATDVGEYVGLGIDKAMLAELGSPRRFVDSESGLAGVFASLGGGEVSEPDMFDELARRLERLYPGPSQRPPHELSEVAWPLDSHVVHDKVVATALPVPMLTFGLDTTTGDLVAADPEICEQSLFVCGGKRAGKSATLVALGQQARRTGWTVVGTSLSPSSPLRSGSEAGFLCVDLEDLEDALASVDRSAAPLLVLIDDIHRIKRLDDVTEIAGLDAATLTVVAGNKDYLGGMQRESKDLGLRKASEGVVLMPQAFRDLDPLGVSRDAVRPETFNAAVAGRGIAVFDGEVIEVTVPLPTGIAT